MCLSARDSSGRGQVVMISQDARDAFRAGRLDEALGKLQDGVRQDPACAATRFFLFQVQALLGQWERATKQLDALASLDTTRANLYALYHDVVAAELVRRDA